MKIIKKIKAGLFCLMFASSVFAQEATELEDSETAEDSGIIVMTVDDAVEYTLNNSRTLKSADIDLEIQKRAADNSWNVFLPTVTVSGTLSRANESNYDTIRTSVASALYAAGVGTDYAPSALDSTLDSYGYKDNENAHWTAVGGFSVGWNFSFAYIQQIKAAKEDYEVGKISYEQSQRETLLNIKKIFYGLLVQQENIKIQKITLENARQRMIQAQTNFRAGLVPEIEMLQTEVTYENTKPNVQDAEQALNQQFDMFAFLLGMPVGTKIELSGSIEPVYIDVTSDELIEKYGNDTLAVRSLQANINVLKMNLSAIELATWTPALSLSWGYQPALPYPFDMGNWTDSDYWSDAGAFTATLAWNITNMLPFSSNRQQAKDLKANIEKLEISMETLKENQKVEVRTAVDTLNQAREQIEAMGRNVNLAQRAYDMTARSYRAGTTELLDLRDSESQLNEAKLGQLNQKYQYISAMMDLENTLNINLLTEYASVPDSESE